MTIQDFMTMVKDYDPQTEMVIFYNGFNTHGTVDMDIDDWSMDYRKRLQLEVEVE